MTGTVGAFNRSSSQLDQRGSAAPLWWFDARGMNPSDRSLLAAISASNCTAVLISIHQQHELSLKKPLVCFIDSEDMLAALAPDVWVLASSEALAVLGRQNGRRSGVYVEIADMEAEFPQCLALAGKGFDYLVIDIPDATYIPYEQLLVRTHESETRILRSIPIRGLTGKVTHTSQSMNAFATMEHGIGVLYRMHNEAEIRDLSIQVDRHRSGMLHMVEAEVISVRHCGLGHRVCVDTTTMMTAEEGMIVGSTGWGGLFVCSETHYLPHMNLREFRVNAGGIHSYIWGPRNVHYYLSEMRAGREILVVDTQGGSRIATVGRAKIERRPLLLIEARISLDRAPPEIAAAVEQSRSAVERVTPAGETIDRDGKYIFVNAFLQNDWHVRMMGADGKVRHCTLVTPGEKLIAHVDLPGRHMGEAIKEHIIEK